MTYRFIGSSSQVILSGKVQELNQFGQAFEMSDEQAAQVPNLPALPDADFKAIGITDSELKGTVPADKRQKAIDAFIARLTKKRETVPPAPSVPPAPALVNEQVESETAPTDKKESA